MSILLDALKKSETQRQLGKTPTIHTAVAAPDAERGTEQQWIALSMLVLSAVAIAWFGWQQFREPVDTLDEAGVEVVAVPRVEETQTPVDEPDQGDMERRDQLNQSFNSYEAEKDTASDKAAELSPTTVVKTSSDSATAQPVAEAAPVATPARRPSRPQPQEPEPISFWQIPQALRDGLPEFRINVLVYAEKPEDRFLLINGQRLEEKEELTDGVVLDEIRRDGAVFRYRNYRFLVKG